MESFQNLLNSYFLIFVPLLLIIEGFFSGSEIALMSADRILLQKMKAKGSERAALALELIQNPERVLSTTLLMTSLCAMGITSLVTVYFLSQPGHTSELIPILVSSFLIVFFGELLPKTIYQRHADRVAPWVAYPLVWTYWIFYPITRAVSGYTDRLSRLIAPVGRLITGTKTRSPRDELRSLISTGRRESEIKTSEKKMIQKILYFKGANVKGALIPLVSIDAIEAGTSVRGALEVFQETRHSRIPVYTDRIDNMTGTLDLIDLMGCNDPDKPIDEFLRPAHYVPETQSLEDVLIELKKERREMTIVVDEHGGAVGILTFKDIMEEIVGEMNDEYDTESTPYKAIDQDSWLVQARMPIQQLNEELRLDIPEGEYESLAGFLLHRFERIPDTGDQLTFETSKGKLRFLIRAASERKIESVLIELQPSDSDSDPDSESVK